MRPSRRPLALLVAIATGAATLAAGTTVAQAATPSTVTIANTLPAWVAKAKPAASPNLAAAAMTAKVYLAPNGGLAALQAKVDALSDPTSASYRKFLTAGQYQAQYAPTAASASAVASYLKGAGLTIVSTEAHNRYVTVSGSKAALNSALGTSLGTFVHNGQTVTAPTKAVTLPTAVGNQVLTVTGLDTTTVRRTPDSASAAISGDAPAKSAAGADPNATPPAGFNNARPCNRDYGTVLATYQADYQTPLPKFKGQTLPYVVCGYTGPSLRSAYEGGTTLDGTGVTVAITDAYAWQYIARDSNTYATNNGDGSYVKGQLTQVPAPDYTDQAACDPSGWSGEETLDVEAVHAMAPAANIRYYASASCNDADFLDALGRVVDDDIAKVVSNSWGDTEANTTAASVAAYEQVLLQGAAQGQSFLWSSGDNGDEVANSGIKQSDYPTSDPYATSVGGTSTAISHGQVLFNAGWGTYNYALSPSGKSWQGTGFLYGAGGGYSGLFNRPKYQNGVVPASAPAGRAVPDVAMDADPNTGFLIGQTQTFPDSVHYGEYRIGGTSLASPLFAGMAALTVQHGGGAGFGLMNPLIYKTATSRFTDVVPGVGDLGNVRVNYNNGVDATGGVSYFVRTFGQDSSLPVTTGWDPVTGVGVPKPSFLTLLAAPAAAS